MCQTKKNPWEFSIQNGFRLCSVYKALYMSVTRDARVESLCYNKTGLCHYYSNNIQNDFEQSGSWTYLQ